jgi:hypothetical protein
MTTQQKHRIGTVFSLSLTLLLIAVSDVCYAAKGGNGGGNGGGDPPAVVPISYAVTPVTLPGNSYIHFGHNEDAAMVGTIIDSPVGGRRALAYLPSISTTQAFYLDDPALGVVGIPEGWHTRTAAGINSQGTIVGNLEPTGEEDTAMLPFLLSGTNSNAPVLQVLGPYDMAATKEVAIDINDSGDMVIWSEKVLSGTRTNSIYLGNQGQTTPFTQIDFASHGITNATVYNSTLQLTNRVDSAPAILTGDVYNGSESLTFRVNFDGSGFEFAPNYVAEDGSHRYWSGGTDINDAGDIAGAAFAMPAKKGKIKNNHHAAIWPHDSDEIVPVGSDDSLQSEWDWAKINNDNDFLLNGPGSGYADTLWHDNGALKISDLIDPDDPNRYKFDFARELTDQRSDGWPTIIAHGSETVDGVEQKLLLVLDPVLNAASAATAAVPEPATAMLLFAALVSFTQVRRVRSMH